MSTYFINDHYPLVATQGSGSYQNNRSVNGTTLTLLGPSGNVTYARGFGTHAASDIRFLLPTNADRFLADIGPDVGDIGGNLNTSIVFQVWNFDTTTKLFDSGTMLSGTLYQSIDVNVAGISILQLKITDAGDGINSDHGDWCNARIVTNSDIQMGSTG